MGLLQPGHLLVILAIVLLIFGPGKLGNLGKAFGDGLRDFRKGADVGDGTRPCPNCRAAVPQRDKFCGVCGSAVSVA